MSNSTKRLQEKKARKEMVKEVMQGWEKWSRYMTFRNPNTHEMAKSEVRIPDKGNSRLVGKTEERAL